MGRKETGTPMNRRNILVITELFLPTKGGTAVWFDEVYRRLGGKNIHVLTADVPGAAEHDRDHVNTIHRVSLQRRPWIKPESAPMYANLLRKGAAILLSNPIDEIHCGRVLPEGLVGWVLARMFRKKLLIYAHGEEITTWTQPAKFRVMRFTYRHADHIIANSEFTRDEALKLGADNARITLIHPGVDIHRFRKDLPADDLRSGLQMGEEARLLLSVGRLSRRKGFDMVIRSLHPLVEEGFNLHYALVGIGEDREYLERLAMEEGVRDRVHFLGHVSMDDLPRWYNACDLFVMPNREIDGDNEGFGMVFMEAAACGKTSIAGDAGGTGAAVLHEQTGLQVDGTRHETVVDALRRLLADSDYRDRLSENAHQRAIEDFSWGHIAEQTRKVMEHS